MRILTGAGMGTGAHPTLSPPPCPNHPAAFALLELLDVSASTSARRRPQPIKSVKMARSRLPLRAGATVRSRDPRLVP